MMLAACNNPAARDTRDEPPASPPGSATAAVPLESATAGAEAYGSGRKKYSWKDSLPKGDGGVNQAAPLYSRLYEADCGGAQRWLNQPAGGAEGWSLLSSPRDVLLFQAAIYFCRGDVAAGRKMFRRADRHSGEWAGLAGDPYACDVYKTAASVVHQRPRRDFSCPGGTAPAWGDPQKNPLNPAGTGNPDESEEPQITEPELTETTPSTSENDGSSAPADSLPDKPEGAPTP
ncbi:hypothetical protein QLQ12_13490 [Actinoplanes sp. NEAU-A12]|uniref:Uncharacterized protein n=1 Tax=Actinoplanes sandaracinus TaxID=3045177 RepID=A0ABT6WIP3_9ACTN|nr:hypothetical protein [Actinoplanes sandaracinus]MDI6099611.1 hypothetical protein [Actinoplanes sandaracinus]